MRIAVLASGEGTTLQAILDAVAVGVLGAEVALVVSNNRDAGALRRARAAGVPALHMSKVTCNGEDALDRAMCGALQESRADVVILAGYMCKVGPQTLRRFSGRILNTHPALLPRHGGRGMYGRRVHEAVIASGDAESGVSVHIVDAEYDSGPVIAQCRVPLEIGETVDTLEAKVHVAEKRLLCNVLQKIADGQILLGPNCLDQPGDMAVPGRSGSDG